VDGSDRERRFVLWNDCETTWQLRGVVDVYLLLVGMANETLSKIKQTCRKPQLKIKNKYK
jgi:hypothetical protein